MGATSHLRKKCNSAIVGNFIFWTTFCVLGQPICIMMYYYAWVLENRPDWLPPQQAVTAPPAPRGLWVQWLIAGSPHVG